MRNVLLAMLPVCFLASAIAKEPDSKIKPISAVSKIEAKEEVFKASSRQNALVIKSETDAAKYFGEKELEALKKQVDFEKQIVLVFAWKGSGQDRFFYDVLETHPEQILFQFKPGRTRDLRQHVMIYVLRNNVKWLSK